MKTKLKKKDEAGNLHKPPVSGMLPLDEMEIKEFARIHVGCDEEGYFDKDEVAKVERIIRATQNRLIHKNSNQETLY